MPGSVGTGFGGYEIEGQIAQGGMGVVYRAWQRDLNRRVALKLLLLGRHASPVAVQRFRREAESAARLQHPNIVRIHEVGVHDGLHFFSMDYIAGRNLADLVRQGPLPGRRAAGYCRAVARAVHHAHQLGVVHRDLKPSNVLIDERDEPRVTDFGLAKRFDDPAEVTVTGEMLGTPNYLSPEQAAGRRGEVGPASDIHALGAMLYELLTGRPPFLAETLGATLVLILQTPPMSPRLLNPGVPRDLETICLKCLEKEPSRRYADAGELAADLDRFLTGQSPRARPVGTFGRLVRWARCRPALAGALGFSGVLLLTMAVGGLTLSWRERAARRDSETANARLTVKLRELEWHRAESLAAGGRVPEALARFARLAREQPGDAVIASRLVSLLSRRSFALPAAPPLRHSGPVTSVAFVPAGSRVVTTSIDGTVALWENDGRGCWRTDCGHAVSRASVGPDGRWVLAARADGVGVIVDVAAGEIAARFPGGGTGQAGGQFNPRGRWFAQPVATGVVEIRAAEPPFARHSRVETGSVVTALQWSPDGARLGVGTGSGRVWWWDAATEAGRESGVTLPAAVSALALTPDSEQVLAGTQDGQVLCWQRRDPAMAVSLGRGGDVVQFLHCSPDGARVLLSRFGDWSEIWDLAALRQTAVFSRTDTDIALAGCWTPDGNRVVLGFRGGGALSHRVADLRPLHEPVEHEGPIVDVAVSPDGRLLATASQDGTARLWRVGGGEAAGSMVARVSGKAGIQLVPLTNGWRMAASRREDTVVLEATPEGIRDRTLSHGSSVQTTAFSPDGARLVTVSAEGVGWIADVRDDAVRVGPLAHAAPVTSVAWSPNGEEVATATRAGLVTRWDAGSGRDLGAGRVFAVEATALRYSPDGRSLAVTCGDATVRVLDLSTLQERFEALRHHGRVWTAEFSPDGRNLVTASMDRTAQVWDAVSGRPVAPPLRHGGPVLVARFSPDGRMLATGAEDRQVRLWETATGRLLTSPLSHAERVWVVDFSPDGRRLLTVADGDSVVVWDVATGFPLTDPLHHGRQMLRGWFRSGGEELLTVTHDGTVHRWRVPSVPAPLPDWLPDLAEAVGGRRLNGRDEVEPASIGILLRPSVRPGLAAGNGSETFYTRWAAWFLAEHERGAPPPWE